MEQRKNVLIMCNAPNVTDWCMKIFNLPSLRNSYNVVNMVTTRESAVEAANKEHVDLIVFFEKTPGIMSISETAYRLRLTGARVIFITANRAPGDLVMEALVGYGIYDIIMNDTITPQLFVQLIEHPRSFRDVAIFHRIVDISDSGTGKRNFVVPKLDLLSQYSKHFAEDYLGDPTEKIVAKQPNKIRDREDHKSISDKMFAENPPVLEKKKGPMIKQQPTPKRKQTYGDITDVEF